MQLLSSLKNHIKDNIKYDFVCKIRNRHEPDPIDLKSFLKNMVKSKETFCQDCNFPLELKIDDEDPERYWVREINY